MEKREFDQHYSLINQLREEANKYRNEFKNQLESLNKNASDALKNLEIRDVNFLQYLKDVSDFNYSDKFTTPADLFPGIRTTSQMIDPEELESKVTAMKNAATDIDNANKVSLLQTKQVMSNIRQALAAFSEYMIRSNQIYDIEVELLEDMDSIYDISDLKKSAVQ